MHLSTPSFAMIVDTVVKSTLLLALAWGAALILKRRSAATQHMVRTFALCALLLLPFSVILLPAWRVKGIPEFSSQGDAAPQQTTARQKISPTYAATANEAPPIGTHRASAPASTATPMPRFKSHMHVAADSKSRAPAMPRLAENSASLAIPALAADVSNASTVATPSLAARLSVFLPQFALSLWGIVACFLLARWRLNTLRLNALVRRANVLTGSGWNAQVRALAGDLGIRRHVALLISDEIEIPITTGIFFPRIVLSPDYQEWSPTRRSAILNHELAHIQRLDALTQSLAEVATAVYWFHPLVWLMARAMRAERERACDDHVLAAGTKASDYAHELLDIVSGLRGPELAAALAMARRS
ncbi:MAG TPA: M56 family metallopeptidase, partial [Candidatus Angelobacter sp.]|nr:M56 family metallopeptidase [Candidatus Angelobacter sp.]